jgi:hypothetical protein
VAERQKPDVLHASYNNGERSGFPKRPGHACRGSMREVRVVHTRLSDAA